MIKLLHTADIHLDSPLKSLALRDEQLRERVQVATREAFTQLVDHALTEQVDAVLISGDLYDGSARSARTAVFLVGELERLRDQGIQVFCIKGNHDAENPVSGKVDLPENVHVFDGRGSKRQLGDEAVWIHGVSYRGKQAPESLLGKFGVPVPDAINIAMLHTSLSGAPGHDVYAPCSVSELRAMGFDYWALGHVHKRKVYADSPWIVMPGIPQGRDVGEQGSKSATLIEIDGNDIRVEERLTSKVEFHRHTIDISGIDTDDELRALIREELQLLSDQLESKHGIARVELTGSPARHWQIIRDIDEWQLTIAELATQTNRLWLEDIRLALTAPASADSHRPGAAEELLELMRSISEEESFKSQLAADAENVLQQIPVARRNEMIPDAAAFNTLAETTAKASAEYVYALIKQTDT